MITNSQEHILKIVALTDYTKQKFDKQFNILIKWKYEHLRII